MPGKYMILVDPDDDKIYKCQGFSEVLVDSFDPPAGSTAGLAYDGVNLISCDYYTDKIYKHQGVSEDVTASFDAPNDSPQGLAWDGSNLLSCDSSKDKIYKHDGLTETITDSFDSPYSNPQGLAWDGTNLLSCDRNAYKVYKHSGFSSTILDSFATVGGPYGLAWDGSNLLVTYGDVTFKYQGFSSTKIDEVDIGGYGLEWISTTVVTYVYHGDPPVGQAVDHIRFKTADNSDKDFEYSLKIPSSGSYYSYWKHVAPYATEAPDNFINNVKFYLRTPFDWPGCTLRVAPVTNYDQATGTENVTGDEASSNHTDHPTMVDANNYTESSPLSLSGELSSGETGKIIDGYLLMQIEVTSSAEQGLQDIVVCVWEYDEA